MASLHVTVEHGKSTQGSQEGSEFSGGWLSLSCVSGEDNLPSRRGNSINRGPGVGGGGQELKPELILTSRDCSGWICQKEPPNERFSIQRPVTSRASVPVRLKTSLFL